jgi:pyruvate dehydrogenase E2 component (dihydrolipoamide acetyltransferase)
MTESSRDVPHFYASAELRMDEAVRLKAELAALGGEFEGITYTHLLLRAVGIALHRVPELNASWDGETVVRHDRFHIGIATATDDGLVVPVVHDCDRTPLGQIVQRARALVERARKGRFAGDDLTGATFSVSNLGMFPVVDFAAIINPPHAGILAVGTVREAAVVRDGRVVPGHLMTVTLSCDHRVVDGVVAGRFLRELSALAEAPLALVV